MQIWLYRQKLKRRWQKAIEPKKLGQFTASDIILGFIKTEKSDSQLKQEIKIKSAILNKKWEKETEKYTVSFKSGRTLEKERIKTEVKTVVKNKLTFKVMKGCNKNDVKESIKSLYGVEIEKVNIVKAPYKKRQRRWLVRKSYVKAIVTLKEWQKVPALDTVA